MRKSILFSLGVCAMGLGCGTSGEDIGYGETPGGSVNVSQGGPQDIAEFRALVEQGLVPSPDTLDPIGFFAEHAIDLPDADCGQDICIHPFLAVAPRFNGGNWTMAFVAMNTAIDPSKLPRPPVHLAIAVETSDYTRVHELFLDAAVLSLAAGLRPEDRISIVSFDSTAQRHVLLAEPGSVEMTDAVGAVDVRSAEEGWDEAALYNGLAATLQAFEDGDAAGFVGTHRVLLLTSGHATGITDPDHILALGEAIVEEGAAFGVIGVGDEYDAKIPAALGSMGAGTYAYAMGSNDLNELFTAEGETTLFPLATDFVLKVLPSEGYEVGRIYGAKRAWGNSTGATLELPALFIGQRDGATDVGGSRRGGGGGLFVELRADPTLSPDIGAKAPAFQVTADWNTAATGTPDKVDATLLNSLAPGENPDGMWWIISDGSSGKPYMMLNMYLALRGALDFYQAGDCERALGVVEMMGPPVGGWLGKYPDTDITDDNNLMLQLGQNIHTACEQSLSSVEPTPPQDFDGGCCAW